MKKSRKILAVMLALILKLSVTIVGFSTTTASAAEVGEDDGCKELGAGGNYTMYVGQTDYFKGSSYYSYILSIKVTTSNPSVASVTHIGGGEVRVTAKKPGSTKITISIKSTNGLYTRTVHSIGYITIKGKPGTPGNLRLQNYGTGFNINWNKTAYAAKYRVFYASEYDTYWNHYDTTKNYFNLTDMTPGTLYYIQVRALGGNNISGGITKAKSLTHVRGTTLNSAVYNSNGTITLNWSYARGANGYAVAKAKAGTKNYSYKYVSSTSYTDASVAAGTRYTYQIRPFYSNGKSAAYAQWSNSKSVTALFKPTITNMNSNSSRLNINWNAIKGAKSFKVAFKRTYDSSWNYRTTNSRYFNVQNPTKGATYVVQVCALNGKNSSPYSAAKSITIGQTMAAPKLSGNTNSSRNYLSWNSVNGAKSFQIAKKTTQQSNYTYITTSSTFYYDYNFTKGKTYTYQVRAFNGSTYGPWSNVMTLKPPVDTPTVTAFYKYSSSRLRATWSSVQGAAYYRVAYKKSGGSWQYQNVSGTQIDFTNPTANSTYYFSVYAVGENGTSSDWSPDYYVYT